MRDYEEEETTSTTTTTATATTPAPAPATGASGGGAVLTAHCEITTGADDADNDDEEDNGDDSNPYNDDADYHTDDVEDATAAGVDEIIDACVDRYYDHHEDSIERLYHPETEADDDDDEEFDAPRQRLLQILDYAVLFFLWGVIVPNKTESPVGRSKCLLLHSCRQRVNFSGHIRVESRNICL